MPVIPRSHRSRRSHRVHAKRVSLRNKRHSNQRRTQRKRYSRTARYFGVTASTGAVEDELAAILLKQAEAEIESNTLKKKISDILSDPANSAALKSVISKVEVTEHAQAPAIAAASSAATSAISNLNAISSTLTSAMNDPISAFFKLF